MNQAQDTPDGLFRLSLSYQSELVKFSAKLELPVVLRGYKYMFGRLSAENTKYASDESS